MHVFLADSLTPRTRFIESVRTDSTAKGNETAGSSSRETDHLRTISGNSGVTSWRALDTPFLGPSVNRPSCSGAAAGVRHVHPARNDLADASCHACW